MAGFSRVESVAILEHILAKKELAKPAKIYLSLLTVVPTSATLGTELTEATGATGYAKIEIPVANLTATAGETSIIKYVEELVFPAITAGSAEVVAWAITDKSGAKEGNMIVSGTCTTTTISKTQSPPTVEKNRLEVTLK